MDNYRADPPVSGRDIILEIRKNMRIHGEQLLYTTVIPASYMVYLHPDDFDRLQGLIPRIVHEAKRALGEELARMNRGSKIAGRMSEWLLKKPLPKEMHDSDWTIEILEDGEGEVVPGDIRVYATFVLPEPGSYGGHLTRRIFTSRLSDHAQETEVPPPPGAGESRAPRLAMLSYEDENGPQTFPMVQPQLVIGRGGAGYWVDLKLKTRMDVSRDHCRLRYDERERRFFIRDHSSFGTTVNGTRIPSSFEGEGEEKKEKNIEVPLPAEAVIGLAETVFLQFKAEAGT
jgi:hypothetical protein